MREGHAEAAERLLVEASEARNAAGNGYWQSVLLATAQVHATLAVHQELVTARETQGLCPHGSTGVCMNCAIPIIEQIGSQITNQVWESLKNVGRPRGTW